MNLDPLTAGVFTLVGIVLGALLQYYLVGRRTDKESLRAYWTESVKDTHGYYYELMEYTLRRITKPAFTFDRPSLRKFPNADLNLIGDHRLLHHVQDFAKLYERPDRPKGFSEEDVHAFNATYGRVITAIRDQEERVARGQKPKYVKHTRRENAAESVPTSGLVRPYSWPEPSDRKDKPPT